VVEGPVVGDPAVMSPSEHQHTLLLLRHSKAEPGPDKRDVDRALSDRGRRDAAAVGEWLAEQGLAMDLVVCSPSTRTRQTWEVAVDGGAEADDVWFDRRVYQADADTLLEVIRETPEEATALMVVGHAPGVPALVDDLMAETGGSTLAIARLEEGFPTSGLAVLSFEGEWSGLGPGDAELEDFVAPRG